MRLRAFPSKKRVLVRFWQTVIAVIPSQTAPSAARIPTATGAQVQAEPRVWSPELVLQRVLPIQNAAVRGPRVQTVWSRHVFATLWWLLPNSLSEGERVWLVLRG